MNFCKNPRCPNFGVPASGAKFSRRAKSGATAGKDYRLAASGAGLPVLKCLLCGEHLPLKSNQGIAEELFRLTSHFQTIQHCCPAEGCPNSAVPVPNSDAYYRFGKTEGGSSRYQCFRAYYNYCLPGADGRTPAMRIGVLDRPISVSELLCA